jgi:arabinofuranan 3-O-arabinosyltransferase
VLAALAYVPLLATEPGRVADDTKQYLYLDPGRLLRSALSSWGPGASGGGVTHQNIGYLLPQGPYYWLLAELHVPVWVAQRLWLGSLVLAAGAGAWYLARVLGLGGAGPLVAGVAYQYSPYFLQYSQRISALVLPWAGLGFMLAFVVLAVRRGGWRYPALFGIVAALVGGTNATALLYVGIAPALYLPYAVLVLRETTWRRVLGTLGRLAAVSAAVSLWWVSALVVEARYGVNVLKYTETVQDVAGTSSPSEVLRGLGYWFFYGGNALGPWLTAAVRYETQPWLIVSSFAVPALAVSAAVVTRWRHRAYFVLLVMIGLVLSVGTYPYAGPGLVGRALRAFMTGTTAGFALRSTDRATPLLVVGLAMLLGAGASALSARRAPAGSATAALVLAVVLANAAPLLGGGAVEALDTRQAQLPSYVSRAAAYLDARGSATRVLVEPGQSQSVYDYGATNDPVWPGVLTRPSIQRQQVVAGGAATYDLLEALDLTFQEGTYEPAELAPVARLLSAGDVLLESDLAYWWYGTPRPRETWPEFSGATPGTGAPVPFGPPVGDGAPAAHTDVDAATLALPPGSPDPPALAVLPVEGPRAIYRAEPALAPLVVDGSGAGLVDAAATGLLDANPTIFYAATLDGDQALAGKVLTPASELLLTDTNAERLQRWTSIAGNLGAVETWPPAPTGPDPSAVALFPVPGAPASAFTRAEYQGAVYVTASRYGLPATYAPEDRAAGAFDGDPSTAWTIEPAGAARDQWVEVRLDHPVTADQVDLVQPLSAHPAAWITRVTLTFDGGRPVTADLRPGDAAGAGQVVNFGARRFETLRVTVDATAERPGTVPPDSAVGFAEVRVPGVPPLRELLALPTDLLSTLGASSVGHRLTVIMTRDRVGPGTPRRTDPERTISRLFTLPTSRTFTVSGTARIADTAPDDLVDRLLGGPAALGGVVVRSSSRLAGDLQARGLSAVDGDPSTAWVPGLGGADQLRAWLDVRLQRPVSFDHLDLQVVADGRHSVPTALRITSDAGADRRAPGATVGVRLSFPTVSGRDLRFTIAAYRRVDTRVYGVGTESALPMGIAELGIPGVRVTPQDPSAPLPATCRRGLLTVDGRPVDVRLVGTVGQAEKGAGVRFEGCGPDAGGLSLGPGPHVVETAQGAATGIDLDRLVLDSAPGGGPMPLAPGGSLQPAPGTVAQAGSPALAAPSVRVLSQGSTSARVEVSGASGPFWLVLGESQDAGWRAAVEGGTSLGPSQLVDGMSNGWYVTPPDGARPFYVDLAFAPQKYVSISIGVSAAALASCLAVAIWPGRWRRRRLRRRRGDAAPGPEPRTAAEGGGSEPGAGKAGSGTGPGVAAPGPGPELRNPLADAGGRPRAGVTVAAAIGVGAVFAALPPPPWGPVLGGGAALVTLLALLNGRGRVVLALLAAGAASATGIDVAVLEELRHVPPGGPWPSAFPVASLLTLVALAALTADVVVEMAREGRPPGPAGARSNDGGVVPPAPPRPVPRGRSGRWRPS